MTFKQFAQKIKDYFRRLKTKIEETVKRILKWVTDNKETAMIIIPACTSVLVRVIRFFAKQYTLKKEQMLKDLYVYDPSMGHYFKLKRPLRNSDWIIISERKNNGEKMANILKSMNVLDRWG